MHDGEPDADVSPPTSLPVDVRRLTARATLATAPTVDLRRPGSPHEDEARCIPDEALAMPDVVPGPAVLARISKLRTKLLGEFDHASPDVAVDLARTFLAIGMVAEARQVAREYVPEGRDRRGIDLVAAVLADAPPRARQAAPLDAECGQRHDLLKVIAAARSGTMERRALSDPHLRRALHSIPVWPRTRMALQLAMAAIKAGDREAASWFRAMAGRGSDLPGDSDDLTNFVDALLDFADGRIERGASVLSALARGGSALSGAASVELARLGVREPRSAPFLDDALLATLGAQARLAGSGSDAAIYWEAEAKVLAHLEGKGDAVERLSLGLMSGRLDPRAYGRALAALDEHPPALPGGRPLALIYDEAPARFTDALRQPAFRKALALSRAEIGATALARKAVLPQDLEDKTFAMALEARTRGFPRQGDHLPRLGANDPEASSPRSGPAPRSDATALPDAAPPGRDGGGWPSAGAASAPEDPVDEAQRALEEMKAEITAIRRMLTDG